MGRSKTAPCRLLVTVEEIRNLPKVNKGNGGADPFAVLEILDNTDQVLVGGDRELYCTGCKTKVMKKSLDGYVTEKFDLGLHSLMVRSGARLRVRVMDFKPAPQLPKGIGFVEVALRGLAENGGVPHTSRHDLLALGEIVTSYGNKTAHGEVLLGYKNPTGAAFLVLTLQLSPPTLNPAEGVPLDIQISPWQFHLLSPEEQDDYDEKMEGVRMQKVEEEAEKERLKVRQAAKEQRDRFERRMQSRVLDPSKRTNWSELQELMTNQLMRREWGYTMDKSSGVGGWRRQSGSGVQELRQDEAERSLVIKYLTYKAAADREDREIREFVAKQRTQGIGEMTKHLGEWADPGGRLAAELHPGSKSLGAAVCHVVSTASLAGRRIPSGGKQGRKPGSPARGESRGDWSSSPGAEGGGGSIVWRDGRIAGQAVTYLDDDGETFGFEELKEAILLELTGGQEKNAWRDAIEIALQLSVTELDMSHFFRGHSLSQERREALSKLANDLRQAAELAKRSGRASTCMISKIDYQDLVDKLEDELDDLISDRPENGEDLVQWKVDVSYLEKLLEDAVKCLEKTIKIREAALGHNLAVTSERRNPPPRVLTRLHEGSGSSLVSIEEASSTGLHGVRPAGSTLRDVSMSRTPTATMTASGLVYSTPAPGLGGKRRWSVETVNGRDFLFPQASQAGGVQLSVKRLPTQEIGETSSGEPVKLMQGDSLGPSRRALKLGSGLLGIPANQEDIVTEHQYVPPGQQVWKTALKAARGRLFSEMDMMNDVRFLSMGGSIQLSPATDRPRPDTSSTSIQRTPLTSHASITLHPDRPGGEQIKMQARFAIFGARASLSGAVVNAMLPPDASSTFANHADVVGKIALFDLPLSDKLLATDLGFVCARQAERAGAIAAMFILESDQLIIASGGGARINPVRVPIFTIGKSQGKILKTWIQPPVRFNPPYISVETWAPEWLAPPSSEAREGVGDQALASADHATSNISKQLVEKWREALCNDQDGKIWMDKARFRIAKELGLEDTSFLLRGHSEVVDTLHLQGNTQEFSGSNVKTAETLRDGLVSADDDGHRAVASLVLREEANFSAATGTLIRMKANDHGIVEICSGVACIISNASHLLPRADGKSRDLAGLERDVVELERVLSKLGFRVFAPQRNKNADEVWSFLRKLKRGFEGGGALAGYDSFAVFVTGHSDGQNVECAVDDAGQVGSLSIQLLMELFNDVNCPGLKGKLKLFVLGLSLGHPVHSPSAANSEHVGPLTAPRDKSTTNILKSIETGGTAKVHSSSCTFSHLVVKDDWLQGEGGLLRDENESFQDHLALSYRGVPYSGTFWQRKSEAGKGEVIIDLGKVVVDINTFSVFQQPFGDGKCTSIWLRHAKHDHSGDEPPSAQNDWEWISVVDTEGNVDILLLEEGKPDPDIVSGSIMGPSRVFHTAAFSTRWLRIEFKNDNSQGNPTGVGLRQIKAFISPSSSPVAAHTPGKPTWVENPAEGAGGPALNRVGPDSIFPLYQMPVYAFAGKPRAMEGAIGLASDYSLLCYSVPVGGISHVPQNGSHLLSSVVRLLEAAHHQHTFQDMFSGLLQGLVDDSCQRFGPGGYGEQVRLLQRRCDADDYPIMLSLGNGLSAVPGIPGEFNTLGGHRHYEKDIPEPRNKVRDQTIMDRYAKAVSLPQQSYDLRFHPRLRSGVWQVKYGGLTLVKSEKSPGNVTALAMALPSSASQIAWQFVVGTVAVLGGNPLSVAKLCVGVVARSAARRLNVEDYQLGQDADSWGLQTGALALYKTHAGSSQRVIGARFSAGDVVTCLLDVAAGTLSFSINGDEESVAPFTNLPAAGLVPAISASVDTSCEVSLSMCRDHIIK